MTTETVKYQTIGGEQVEKSIQITRKISTYKNEDTSKDNAYFRKIDQFHKLCAELGFNKVSLGVMGAE
jgi:hypothetical protein